MIPILSFRDLIANRGYDDARNQSNVDCGGAGCVLVHLGDEEDAAVLDRMWKAMESIFTSSSSKNEPQQQSRGDDEGDTTTSTLFHHQTLSRDDQEDSDSNSGSGYDYVHYPPVNEADAERLHRLLLVKASGEGADRDDDDDVLETAFRLVARVGHHWVAAAYCAAEQTTGTTTTTMEEALRVVDNLLLDNDKEEESCYSGSFQRLSRYKLATSGPLSSNDDDDDDDAPPPQEQESIRPHCDWSLATLVPVSAVTGLEIYSSNHDVWIRPEQVARRHYDHHYKASSSSSLQKNPSQRQPQQRGNDHGGNAPSWHSRYVVVLAGKWLELLSNGAVQSTIHRVVMQHSKESKNRHRLSAPLFLRPTREASEDAENLDLVMMEVDVDDDYDQAAAWTLLRNESVGFWLGTNGGIA